jgi:hypothetical protein
VKTGDTIVIEADSAKVEEIPAPTAVQEQDLPHLETDLASGVAWHPGTVQDQPTKLQSSRKAHLARLMQTVASWYLQIDGKFVDPQNKDARHSFAEIQKLVPIRVAEAFPGDAVAHNNAGKLTASAIFGASADPRMAFGVYSGKAYPVPGNPSPRLFRNNMWDINTWQVPGYRELRPSLNYKAESCAFSEMLAFAVPTEAERNTLLNWLSWNLQNEHRKPTWSILLYSESKGTGKSTIGEVCAALFGAHNTAPVNGIANLTQRFAADVLSKKFVLAEEVHISSHTAEGNALKDLITNRTISVEPKYQSVVTIPQTSCFLFTTNHKPLWLEGGERRYYIIDMDHDGQAQGPRNDEFVEIVGRVKIQINSPQGVRNLYERLMRRSQAPSFDPNNMGFADNATPIMRELQATSGNEGDEVLTSLLTEYGVTIIPSEDFPELIRHLRLRNANALRNALSRLGWEPDRVRFGGKQRRVLRKTGLKMEHGRVLDAALANTYHSAAETSDYVWFDIEFYIHKTWKALRSERLVKIPKSADAYSARDSEPLDNSEGHYGPFASSKSHLRIQAREQDELQAADSDFQRL